MRDVTGRVSTGSHTGCHGYDGVSFVWLSWKTNENPCYLRQYHQMAVVCWTVFRLGSLLMHDRWHSRLVCKCVDIRFSPSHDKHISIIL